MRVMLGQVTVTDGLLLIVDFGLLSAWRSAEHSAAAKALAASGGGVLDLGGPSAVVVGGVPPGTHAVSGRRTAGGQQWDTVDVELKPGGRAVRVEPLGEVLVDMARLMAADLTRLNGWQADGTADGLADVAFWGRDADALAAEVGAGKIPDGSWGWVDLPAAAAESRVQQLEDLKSGERRFMVDYRPHNHAFAALAQTRASPLEVGHVVIDGGMACCFMTSWGDGLFPVLALRDAEGGLVGVRIDMSRNGQANVLSTDPVSHSGVVDPMSAAKASMAKGASDMATSQVRRMIVGRIKQYLPRFLWPLIPGEGGTVAGNVEYLAKRRLWSMVTGCGCSVLFALLFAGAFGGVALIIAFALATS